MFGSQSSLYDDNDLLWLRYLTNIEQKVCAGVFVCHQFRLLHRLRQSSLMRWAVGGNRFGLILHHNIMTHLPIFLQLLFGQSSHCQAVAECLREKAGHFWGKQHWYRIVLEWETRLGTPPSENVATFSLLNSLP